MEHYEHEIAIASSHAELMAKVENLKSQGFTFLAWAKSQLGSEVAYAASFARPRQMPPIETVLAGLPEKAANAIRNALASESKQKNTGE